MTKSLTSDPNSKKIIKFLYSYNGQILPRLSDGVLRYVGGHTRILSVHRSISFSDLLVKFGELTGTSVNLKCKLPSEDLDVLVSIKSDEELRNIIDEYDRVSESSHQELKIRAILSPVQSAKKLSSPSSPSSPMRYQPLRMAAPVIYTTSTPSTPLSFNCSPTQSRYQPTKMAPASYQQSPPRAAAHRCCSPLEGVGYPAGVRKDRRRSRCCPHGSPRQQHFVPYSNTYCR